MNSQRIEELEKIIEDAKAEIERIRCQSEEPLPPIGPDFFAQGDGGRIKDSLYPKHLFPERWGWEHLRDIRDSRKKPNEGS